MGPGIVVFIDDLMGASIDSNISPSYFGSLEGIQYITDVKWHSLHVH